MIGLANKQRIWVNILRILKVFLFVCFVQTVVLGILMRSIGNKNTILLGLGFQILQLAWYGFGSQPWSVNHTHTLSHIDYIHSAAQRPHTKKQRCFINMLFSCSQWFLKSVWRVQHHLLCTYPWSSAGRPHKTLLWHSENNSCEGETRLSISCRAAAWVLPHRLTLAHSTVGKRRIFNLDDEFGEGFRFPSSAELSGRLKWGKCSCGRPLSDSYLSGGLKSSVRWGWIQEKHPGQAASPSQDTHTPKTQPTPGPTVGQESETTLSRMF